MKAIFASLLTGLVFGLGLTVSGMTQADKVIAFLDLSDNWDPSLAFVMGGAIGVHVIAYQFILKQPSPLFGERFGVPSRTDIDARLVAGSAIFGVGWAIGGYCPGPGLVSASSGSFDALIFAGAMTGGMLLFHVFDEAWKGYAAQPTTVAKAEVSPDSVAELQKDARAAH